MALINPNPSGFSVGAKLTSAQANLAFAEIAIALDKSTAGDTLSGVVSMASTAALQAEYTNNISSTAAAGIISSIAGGIASTVPGGIELAGGSTDEIAYTSARTVQLALPFVSLNAAAMGADSADWSTGSTFGSLLGPGPAKPGQSLALGPLPMHNGSTLTFVDVYLTVANHTTFPAAIPAELPLCEVHRFDVTTGTDLVIASARPSPSTMANWNATTFWSVPVSGPNNVIDRTRYYYYVLMTDEWGTASIAGNAFHGVTLTMSDITTMAFA